MRVKEIADAMNVSKDVVKNSIRRNFPDLMQQGVITDLNEQQVAVISNDLKSNTQVQSHLTDEESSSVAHAYTELEIIQNAATAMAQLQSLIQQKELEVKKLQIELDQSKDWWTVKRVLIETGREYPWRPLKKYSLEHGYEIQKAFDKNYDEVNAYHVDVWHDVYGLEL